MEILGMEDSKYPAEIIVDNIESMMKVSIDEYNRVLVSGIDSMHEIGYRKGKIQAFKEILEMLATGKIPE